MLEVKISTNPYQEGVLWVDKIGAELSLYSFGEAREARRPRPPS